MLKAMRGGDDDLLSVANVIPTFDHEPAAISNPQNSINAADLQFLCSHLSCCDRLQSELTISEREVLEHDRERYKRLGAGAHLDEWMEFYPGLRIRRHLAMKIAHTNRPEGRRYAEALSALYRADGFDTNDKTYMHHLSAVLWINDDPEHIQILREIRDAMTPGERSDSTRRSQRASGS